MQVLTLTGTINSDGYLRLELPTQLPSGKVELVLVINPKLSEKPKQRKYDFSDLAGKLTLQGDPVAIQNQMRDAW